MATATGQVDGIDDQDPNSKAIRFLCGLKQHPADESAAIQSFYETLQPDERGWAQRFLRSNHPRITLLGFLYSYASSSPRAIRSQPSNVRGSTFYNDASRTWSVLRLADMSSQAAPQHLWLPDLGCIAAIQRAWPDLTPGAHAALLLNSYLPSDPEERAATISVAANLLDSCTSYDEFEQELHLLIASAAVPPSNGAPNTAPLATAVPRSSTNAATPAATLPPINIFNQLAARSSTGAPLAEHIQSPRQQAMDAPAATAAALPTRDQQRQQHFNNQPHQREQHQDDQHDLGLARRRQVPMGEIERLHCIYDRSTSPVPCLNPSPRPAMASPPPLDLATCTSRPLVSYASSPYDFSDSEPAALGVETLPDGLYQASSQSSPLASRVSLSPGEHSESQSPPACTPTRTRSAPSSVPTKLRSDLDYRNPTRVSRGAKKTCFHPTTQSERPLREALPFILRHFLKERQSTRETGGGNSGSILRLVRYDESELKVNAK
ncbi:uncharacterized protein UHOD_11977 [Ustilago sp. UG-2017b]|nr:uncharacterized protein UHOD_11977 [Ustilago sp. UG-2017b]